MSEASVNPVATVMALADRVERLSVSHRDPAAFFEERSEVAAELREVAGSFPATGHAGGNSRDLASYQKFTS